MAQYVQIRLLLVFIFGFLATGCATTHALKDTLTAADELAAQGAWDEAVFKYAEVRKKDPGNLEYIIKYRRARAEAAHIHYNRGQEHLDEGNHEAALLEFQAALILNPALKAAEERIKKTKKLIDSLYYYGKGVEFLRAAKKKEAKDAFKRAVSLNPENEAASSELEKLKTREGLVMDGYELDIKSTKPITLEFKDVGIKKIFNVISKLSGINFIFDSDVRDTKASILLKEATFKQALELILLTNKLKRKVVSDNTIVIYPATPQKSKQYEEMLIKVFYLTNIDAKNTVNLLRTMIKARDMFVHADLNAIVIRARPEAIELAQRILEAADLSDAEVMLTVDIMEINREKNRNLGIDYPNSVTLAVPQETTVGIPGGSATGILLGDLGSLSSEDLLLSIPPGIINFSADDFDGELLANPRIRVKNNEKASIHIGERVPTITTTIITGGTTQENVQYQDVGIKLDVEPTIRPNDEIDLKLRLEVSSISAEITTASGGVVFQIGTRNTDTTLRLSDGETQIIGGLIEDEERTTTVKVPGLGEIPVIGRLFASEDKTSLKTDILMAITPHILRRLEVPDEDVRSIWSGREDIPSTAPIIEGFLPPGRVTGPPESFETEEGEIPFPPPPPPPGVFPGLPEGLPPPGSPPEGLPPQP
jgi:general secretion pathway protein D